jgi:formamidopyrimidine-DNA glycosylase
MPELPEVETIRRQLNQKLAGARIAQVDLLRTGRESPKGKKFVESLRGKKIERIERRAKLLVWRFSDGGALTTHLKMSGRLILVGHNYQPQKHDRAIFIFVGARHPPSPRLRRTSAVPVRVVWSDVRQFGYMKVVAKDELVKILGAYGSEPLESSEQELVERLKSPKTRKIKVALMDQTNIAGIGNIYADEICFRAKILPTRRLASLSEQDRRQVAREIKKVLREAVQARGTSADAYVDARGKAGAFEKKLRVYGRAGKPCVVCGTLIKKIRLAQRGTHFCPKCQT